MDKKDQIFQLYDAYRAEFIDREIVVGEGNVYAEMVLVGEAPGKDEVKLSRPFVGMAGKNLNEFLQILGIQREDIYITNAIKYRLSEVNPKTGRVGNRPATASEIGANRRYLLDEIHLLGPKYIVTLGNVPLKALMGNTDTRIGDIHGQLNSLCIYNKEYSLFPLYHPASIIYNQSLKSVYLKDIEILSGVLEKKK